MVTTKEIYDALTVLPAQDLEQIKARAEFLLGQTAKTKHIEDTTNEELLFDVLTDHLHSLFGSSPLPWGNFVQIKAHPLFMKNAKKVDAFINNLTKDLTQIERIRVYRLCISLISQNLRELRVPLSISSITSNLSRAPELFDRSFPGYIKAGLGHLIIRAACYGSSRIKTEGKT